MLVGLKWDGNRIVEGTVVRSWTEDGATNADRATIEVGLEVTSHRTETPTPKTTAVGRNGAGFAEVEGATLGGCEPVPASLQALFILPWDAP